MRTDFITIIESAGLSTIESSIYGALLQVKNGTITDISKNTGLKRATIYNNIRKLERFGLVSKLLYGKRFFYSAVHPQRLLQLATLNQSRIKENLPVMIGAYYGSGEKPKIQMFEGIDAVRDIYFEMLNRIKDGEELCIFTNIGRVIQLFPEIPESFKKIIGSIVYKSKVRELVLGDDSGKKYAGEILRNKKVKNYRIRLFEESFRIGDNEQFIFKDKIIFFSLQKYIFVVVIENEDLANSQRVLFDFAWNQGQEYSIEVDSK
jgi:HTH-type transcriptional regulator, sugar sensing transcriptional regulator